MKSALTLAGLLLALGVGYFVYTKSLTSAGVADAPPQQTIDTIDIKTNLMNIGQAERTYLVSHGTYGTPRTAAAGRTACAADRESRLRVQRDGERRAIVHRGRDTHRSEQTRLADADDR